MVYPNLTRVEKIRAKEHSLTTVRSWDAQFLSCSELFFPIMPYGQFFSNYSNWPSLEEFNQQKPANIKTWSGLNLKFVLQKGRRSSEGFESLYEPRIFLQGEIRTRLENWHDFYNALIWFTFPKVKAALNMRQFIAFDEHADFPWKAPPKKRTREQDFLTIFDEGGCILAKVGEHAIPFVFGHAVYERMILGDRDISMSCFVIECPKKFALMPLVKQIEFLDDNVAKILSQRLTYQKDSLFYPLKIKHAQTMLSEFQHLRNAFG